MDSGTGVPWAVFEGEAPEIARAGLLLLEDAPGVPGVAFLGTVGVDGLPRMHPFIPAVVDGDLWAFVIESPKQRDLDRSAGFAVHSRLGANDESFFIAGTASRVDADDRRSRIGLAMPFSDIDDRHLLYRFGMLRALWTTWTNPTTPAHRRWVGQPN